MATWQNRLPQELRLADISTLELRLTSIASLVRTEMLEPVSIILGCPYEFDCVYEFVCGYEPPPET